MTLITIGGFVAFICLCWAFPLIYICFQADLMTWQLSLQQTDAQFSLLPAVQIMRLGSGAELPVYKSEDFQENYSTLLERISLFSVQDKNITFGTKLDGKRFRRGYKTPFVIIIFFQVTLVISPLLSSSNYHCTGRLSGKGCQWKMILILTTTLSLVGSEMSFTMF